MKNILIILSKVVSVITFLNIFAWSIFHVYNGGDRFGVLTNGIKEFAEFPKLVFDVFSERSYPESLLRIDPDFKPINDLTYDVFALNSKFNESKWNIRLMNLRNDSTIFNWYLEEKSYQSDGRIFPHAAPIGPIILSDTSLILNNDETHNLYRLDANSRILWHNTKHNFHHAINLDSDGNIWACTSKMVELNTQGIVYRDDHLTKIDVNNGQVLFHKSLSEIFFENKMKYLIHGYGNIVGGNGNDPFHLNEIQPVLKDGKYWKEGDLFVSLRHRSAILLYRPSTNKIIRIIQGPFLKQHDIDILSDSTISLFNNNQSGLRHSTQSNGDNITPNDILNDQNLTLNIFANVQVYNLNDSSFNSLYLDQFVENKIFTHTQGLHHVLSNGDLFIEDWDDGKVYIFNEDKILLKKYYNQPVNGLVEYPHWVRIYETLHFLN